MIDSGTSNPLPKTRFHLPPYGLGTGLLGEQDEQTAVATIQTAFEQGIRLFDTAPLYGSGKAERFLGQALCKIKRSDFIVSSKVGRLVQADDNCIFDFSRDGVMRSLEQSLERLKMDYVDVLHIHDPDNHYHQALNETFPVLAELRSQGIIKAIGAGMNQWQMLYDFANQADFDCFLLAGRYTLLEQTALPFLDYCSSQNIAVILGGIYNSGILANPIQGALYNYQKAPETVLKKAQILAKLCQDFELPLNALALQFPYAHQAVSAVVVGSNTSREVLDNLQYLKWNIPSALWHHLIQEGLLPKEVPIPVG